MTSICDGNGPSHPKAHTQQVVSLGAVAISDFLLSQGVGWAFDLAVALGIISYDTAPFCAGEPPTLPNIPPERYFGYFNPLNPQGAAQLRADMADLVGHYFWYASCECVSGIQPPAPPPAAAPTGVAKDPPALGQPVQPTHTCYGPNDQFANSTSDSSGNLSVPLFAIGTPAAGLSWGRVYYTGLLPVGGSYPITWTLRSLDAAGQPLATHVWLQRADVDVTAPATTDFSIPRGTANLEIMGNQSGANLPNFTYHFIIRGFCTPAPQALEEPCCPPDPLVVQLLNQILRELDELATSRPGSGAYRRGTPHPALSGTQSIPVSDLVGVLVEVTAGIPARIQIGGNPTYQWDLGFLSMLTADGMILERRLTRQAQLWLDPQWPLATVAGLYLNPGVQVTLTELVPA